MKRILSLLLIAILAVPAFAEEIPAENETKTAEHTRPRVGVVLSGGGAKGMAHIGALKVLEELDIPVDFIVGTSIGSIMAGFYALGYSADELDSLVRSQNWNEILNDEVMRRRESFEQKKLSEKYVITLPFMERKSKAQNVPGKAPESEKDKGNFLSSLPAGIVSGQNLNKLFTKLSVGYQDNVDFNTLPIPFACVAVDLNKNEEVVFRSGNIVNAIRASMAIPGYFAPVVEDGKYMIDGGILNNFPVDVARQMGADIVIGVDLHHHRRANQGEVKSIAEMISRMLDSANGPKYEAGRADADYIINPNTTEFGILSFDEKSISALIDSGYVAAKRELAALQRLADEQHEAALLEAEEMVGPTRTQYQPPKAINLDRDSVLISQISVMGIEKRELTWLLKKTELKPGTMVSGEEIDDAMNMLYDTRAFEKIEFAVAGNDNEGYGLKVNFKPRKMHVLGFSFRADTEEAAAILVGIGVNKNKLFGLKFDADLKIAYYPKLDLNFGYTFHNMTQLNASFSGRSSTMNNLINPQFDQFGLSSFFYTKGQLDYQIKGPKNINIRAGGQALSYWMLKETMDDPFGIVHFPLYGAYVKCDFDNLDDSYFPNKGMDFSISGSFNVSYDSDKALAEREYCHFWDGRLRFKGVVPLGSRLALIPQVYSRMYFGPSAYMSDDSGNDDVKPFLYPFATNFVGGAESGRYISSQMPFVGTTRMFQTFEKVAIGRVDLRCNIKGNHYLFLKGNYMLQWPDWKSFIVQQQRHWGVALGYSLKTIVGPLSIDAQWSNLNQSFTLYASLGYSF